MRPIITLTTDWRKADFYVGTIKGALLSKCATAEIIDISHQISPFSVYEAGFILRNAYHYFPEGTIHIVGVNAEIKNARYIAAKYQGHYFISADNGIFSLLGEENHLEAVQIDKWQRKSSFPELDIFTHVAAFLAEGHALQELGPTTESFGQVSALRPIFDEFSITGQVIYVDSFKNAITNITKSLFHKLVKQQKFEIRIQRNIFDINQIRSSYADVPPGEVAALFNSLNLLEIAINGGNAEQLLGLEKNATVRVKFG
ncbi:MAG: SAM-dependent chlorinase/fluorinase [Bacteroidales bacterium]|jgi:S-adenosylmethionine hydrolase